MQANITNRKLLQYTYIRSLLQWWQTASKHKR